MQGDSNMLKKYMLIWFERFSGNVPVPDASPTWRDYLVSLYLSILKEDLKSFDKANVFTD